jgi:hypothetical protein
MLSRVVAITFAALLGIAGTATAQTTVVQGTAAPPAAVHGTVVQVDPGSRVIVLDGGRTIQVGGGTQLTVNGQPVTFESVRPGSVVTVQSAPAPQPSVTVQTAPAAQPARARHIVRGVVTDVDRDGEITVKSPDGEFEVHVTPATAAAVKEGDTMTMEITFQPGSEPAASPALR